MSLLVFVFWAVQALRLAAVAEDDVARFQGPELQRSAATLSTQVVFTVDELGTACPAVILGVLRSASRRSVRRRRLPFPWRWARVLDGGRSLRMFSIRVTTRVMSFRIDREVLSR